MSEFLEVKGLVLRTTDVGESDRMLTVYSAEGGLLSAMAKGSRSLKSKKMPATSQFCYSEFLLYEQGDKLWVREASVIDSFFGVRDSLEGLALGGYICEVFSAVATADGDKELMRLLLNTLYVISEGGRDLNKVKLAFEIRLMSELGFTPEVRGCRRCGGREGAFYLDVMAGALECSDCKRKAEGSLELPPSPHEASVICPLSSAARFALEYAIYAPLERLYSFNLDKEDLDLAYSATEKYLLNHLERGFKTLDFYNEVRR